VNVQQPPQFTPSQVLEAGRRAETEGRGEYALQFYRHLVENYPGTGEAAAAQSALTRILTMSNASLSSRLATAPPPPAPSPADPRFDLSFGGQPLNNPFDQARPYEPPFQQPAGYAPAQQAPTPPPYAPAEGHADPHLMVELPSSPRDYRTGRFLARLFSWLGGLTSLLGIVLLGLSVVSPRLVGALPLIGALSSGPVTSVLLVFGGMFQIMIGQLVRAVLDHSLAARDLAAMARAEAEARYGSPPGRSRRR
jgi:hypothetical protein